ncbi:MAG: GAF domain-containing protein [bacterium]
MRVDTHLSQSFEPSVVDAATGAAKESTDAGGVCRTALKDIAAVTEPDAAAIWALRDGELVLMEHIGFPREFVFGGSAIEVGHCLCGQCAQTGEPLAIDQSSDGTPVADGPCRRAGFESIAVFPMKMHALLVGVICVASRQRSAFGPRDRQVITAVARGAAAGVRNARLYKEAHRRVAQLETAALVGRELTRLSELSSLLKRVVTLIRESFGYYQVHILLIDRETDELVLQEASGPSAELIQARGLRLKVGQEGITGWVAGTGEPVLCGDTSQEQRFYQEELLPETRAELAVPLRIRNQVIGVLDVQSDQYGAFDEQDLTGLQVLGSQVASAILNARLFQETNRRYEAMVALHETSLDLLAQLETAQLLDSLLRRAVRLVAARVGSLCLYDGESGLVRNVANYGSEVDWVGRTFKLGEGLIGRVILAGKHLIVQDYDKWAGKVEPFAGTSDRRMMGVPLRWGDDIIGGIVVRKNVQSRQFNEDDAWVLSLFADLASIALKNAELYSEVDRFSRVLEHRVEERTRELARAKEEIGRKAEQLKSLLAKTIHVQEKEQGRIARDMHDGVVQLITAARYELQAARVALRSHSVATAREKVNAARRVLKEIEEEIGCVIHDLHPPTLNTLGLVPALKKRVDGFERISGVICHLQVHGNPSRLPSPTEVAIFRVVEEALHNVASHARASRACVTLDFQSAALGVTVQDDGKGFDFEQWKESRHEKHLGLLGMRERVEGVGGNMTVRSTPGSGTRVMFRVPIVR